MFKFFFQSFIITVANKFDSFFEKDTFDTDMFEKQDFDSFNNNSNKKVNTNNKSKNSNDVIPQGLDFLSKS